MKKIKLSKSSRKLLKKMLEDGIKQMPKSRESKQQKQFLNTLLTKINKAPKKTGDITLNPMETKYLREVMAHTRKHFSALIASSGFFKRLMYKIVLNSYKELFKELLGVSKL